MHRLRASFLLVTCIVATACVKSSAGFTPAPQPLPPEVDLNTPHDLRGDQIWVKDGCYYYDYVIYNKGMTPVRDIDGNHICPTK
jgi:hypothetical protein